MRKKKEKTFLDMSKNEIFLMCQKIKKITYEKKKLQK